MKREEANEMLIARFEQLNKVAEDLKADGHEIRPEELCALCDSAHKMYITLSNAGAFEDEPFPKIPESNGIKQ